MLKKLLFWLKEAHCSNCGRLLGKLKGEAEIKCSKCGQINTFNL